MKVFIDSTNPMKILQFEDMRLEDERGEVWGSIQNGTTAYSGDDGEYTFFLQSNYFSKPEKLYLRMNKVQAVKVDEAIAEINTETGEWLNQPEDQKIQLVKSDTHHAEFIMPEAKDQSFPYSFASALEDAKGKEMHSPSIGSYSSEEGKRWDISFSPTTYTNPVKLELFAYPNYLEGDIKIELK